MKYQNVVESALNSWKKQYDSQIYKSLINNITIKEIKEKNLHVLRVNSQNELRALKRKSVSCMDTDIEAINSIKREFDPKTVDVWAYDLHVNKQFESNIYEHILPESKHAEICSSCNGSKTEICSSCSGHIDIECPSCSGSGYISCFTCGGLGTCLYCNGSGSIICSSCGGSNTCSSCGGAGYFEETVSEAVEWHEPDGSYRSGTEFYTVQRNCAYCFGGECPSCSNGQIDCHHCRNGDCPSCYGGQVICDSCSGSGRTNCFSCSGLGEVDCFSCSGKGGLLHYYYIEQKICNIEYECTLTKPSEFRDYPHIIDDLTNYLGEKTEIKNIIYDGQLTIENLKSDVLESLDYDSDKLFTEFESLISDSANNHLHKIQLFSIPYIQVTYSSGDSNYILAIDPITERIYYKTNPLECFVDNSFITADSLFKSKKYMNALRFIYPLLENKKSARIKNLHEEIMKQLYKKYFSASILTYLSIYFAFVIYPLLNKFPLFSVDMYVHTMISLIMWGIPWFILIRASKSNFSSLVKSMLSKKRVNEGQIIIMGSLTYGFISICLVEIAKFIDLL